MRAIEKLKALDADMHPAPWESLYTSIASTYVFGHARQLATLRNALPEIVAVLEAQADELAAHRSVAGGYITLSSVSDAALAALEAKLDE